MKGFDDEVEGGGALSLRSPLYHCGQGGGAYLSASMIDRVGERLITSFDAQPDDHLVMAIDVQDGQPFWNASTRTPPERLRKERELLPLLAEAGLCRAGKDISNGGVIGTLAMLCHCSQVGVHVDLDNVPIPPGGDREKWPVSFPSYGYLLAVEEAQWDGVLEMFRGSGITVAPCGRFSTASSVAIESAGRRVNVRFETFVKHDCAEHRHIIHE